MGKEITSLMVHNESTFAASGNQIGRFVRGKQVGKFVTKGIEPTYEDDSSSDESQGSESESDEEEEEEVKDEDEVLSELVLFGNTLVALSKERKRMYVWDIPPYSNPASKDPALAQLEQEEEDESSDEEEARDGQVTPYAVLEFPNGFTPTKVVHPASYLNKVIVASKEGEVSVWNIRTG